MSSEKKVILELRKCTLEDLKKRFGIEDNGVCFRFEEIGFPKHYVTVEKEPLKDFGALVNADFDFARPAGSNNYRELEEIGKRLVKAFDETVSW